MRKIVLLSLALVLCCVLAHAGIVAGAVDNSKILSSIPLGQDSLIIIAGDTMVVHEYNDYITINPKTPRQTPSVNSAVQLAAPANDNCANAQPINDVQDLPFDTRFATFDGPGGCITSPNIWYIYTASTTGPVMATLCGSQYNSKIAVYDGSTCPAYTTPTPRPLQGGETIETATVITDPLPVAYTSTTAGYNHDYTAPPLCSFGNTAPDVVYSYVATFNGSINIDINPSGYWFPVILVLDANSNVLACDGGAGYPDFLTQILNFPITIGETYYLIVSGYLDSNGTYTLKISSPDYVLLGCNDKYYSVSSQVSFDAIQGNQYLIEVGGEDRHSDSTGTGVLSIGPSLPPLNDVCENATRIGDGILHPRVPMQFAGNNTGATVDTCTLQNGYAPPQAWITFTTEDTMDVTIDYCDSPNYYFGTFYSILINSCPCGDPIRWSRYDFKDCINGNPTTATICITWNSLPPGTYWYPIATACSAQGPYGINVTGLIPQYCSDDALFGQDPGNSLAYGSEVEANYAVAEKFSQVTGTINQVTWWGINIPDSLPSSSPFQIIFCRDYHGFPADTSAAYNVSALSEETGYAFGDFQQKKFVAVLDQPLEMTTGWIIIRGNSGTDSCWFYWLDAGEGTHMKYDPQLDEWNSENDNLAFCLSYDSTISAVGESSGLPSVFNLSQNYPNPFNATTSIQFSLKKAGNVTLSIYDVLGRKINTLYNGTLPVGSHSLIWNGTDELGKTVTSGIYFYRLESADGSIVKRMVLLK
jgi:hypothetical protein